MDEKSFKTVIGLILVALLFILAFFILKPILISIITGILLAYIFYPIYKRIFNYTKKSNISALIICLLAILIILIPILFFTPIIIRQVFDIYIYLQGVNIATSIQGISPSIFTPEIAKEVGIALNNFVGNIVTQSIGNFANLLVNLPVIFLQIAIVLFVFFFSLRDMEKITDYIKSLSPVSKQTEKEFFKKSKDVTNSVIYGQFIIGLLQGITTGIGLLIFQIPNTLTLTLLATLVGIIPIIGPWLIWFPVALFLIISGKTFAGVGLLLYGSIIISWIDTVFRPLLVSWKTKVNSALILIGMIGGLFAFGILGLIIGPLVISYLLLILEIYRNKKFDFIFSNTNK
jgi:predicted PurR-regulated permease PerM